MKDFVGNELSENNLVLLIMPNYREFVMGRITGFTAQNVRVEFRRWKSDKELTKLLQDPKQLVKMDGPDALAYALRTGV